MLLRNSHTEKYEQHYQKLIWIIIIIGGLVPLLLYWFLFGRVENVTPEQAQILLLSQSNSTALVDIHSADSFAIKHIEGAYNWPRDEIFGMKSPDQIPRPFANKKMLLICEDGRDSTKATRYLNRLGVPNVANVRGGLIDWIGSIEGPHGGIYERWKTSSGEPIKFPHRNMSWAEQMAQVASGFGFKSIYTLLSFILIIILWRCKAIDLVALRWGLIYFFIGENFCLANYVFYFEKSYLFEYLHSYGMLLCFGFCTYAIIEGFDRRILFLSDLKHKCASLSLCRECIKYKDVPCGLKRMFYFVIPACMILCCIPMNSILHSNSYNADIFGTYYHYSHPLVNQLYEIRYCPIMAIVMYGISFAILVANKNDPLPKAKLFFAAGTGALGFGILRMMLVGVFSDNQLWFGFWEEGTELLFIAGVCATLWIFRNSLLHPAVSE